MLSRANKGMSYLRMQFVVDHDNQQTVRRVWSSNESTIYVMSNISAANTSWNERRHNRQVQ